MSRRTVVLSTLSLFLLLVFSTAAFAGDTPHVLVTDSQSWEMGGGSAGVDGTFGGAASGGARPQTAEIIKTFAQRCPNTIITNRRDKADYVVELDHEGGKSSIARDNKIVVFNVASGDLIYSGSTRSLGNAVKDACPKIFHDFANRQRAKDSNQQIDASVTPAASSSTLVASEAVDKVANVHVSSSPLAADISVDGKYVGSTPSNLQLAPGDHVIVIEKRGFGPWQKTIHVVPGDVNVVAELIQQR